MHGILPTLWLVSLVVNGIWRAAGCSVAWRPRESGRYLDASLFVNARADLE